MANDIFNITIDDIETIANYVLDSDYYNNQKDMVGTRNTLLFMFSSKNEYYINAFIEYLNTELEIHNDLEFTGINQESKEDLMLFMNDFKYM